MTRSANPDPQQDVPVEHADRHLTRRDLTRGGIGLAGTLLCGCGAEPSRPTRADVAVPATDTADPYVDIETLYRQVRVDISTLEVDTVQFVAEDRVVIGRDGDGVYAMSSICPHANCDMRRKGEITSFGLACNCHGSRFDRIGRVLRGPAERDLVHYLVSPLDQDTVLVEINHNVPQSTRLQG